MKLGTDFKCQRMVWVEKKNHNSSTFFAELCTLKLSVWKSCPLYNLKIVEDIFMKLGRKIN